MGENRTVTPQDVEAFQRIGREFVKDHPDLPELIDGMEPAGFQMSHAASSEIILLKRPDVTYWLTLPEGRADAHALKNLENKPDLSREYVTRLADRLTHHGFAQRYERKLSGTDEYIEQRRREKRRR